MGIWLERKSTYTVQQIILPPILNIPNYEPENTAANHVDHQQNSGGSLDSTTIERQENWPVRT